MRAVITVFVAALAFASIASPAPQPAVTNPWIIELEGPPVAEVYARTLRSLKIGTHATQSAETQAAIAAQTRLQKSRNEAAQTALLAELTKAAPQTKVVFRVQNAFNGIAVQASDADAARLRRLPGVKSVRRLAVMERDRATALQLSAVPTIWSSLGLLGEGMSIGIADTGVDYTHSDFGGSGVIDDFDLARTASKNPLTPNRGDAAGFEVRNAANVLLYPSVKVVGGFDFAGDSYNAGVPANATPVPDPNPIDCPSSSGGGHGTHVAGVAGGYGVNANGTTFAGPWDGTVPFNTMRIGPGVAPQVDLHALKVFGCNGSTSLALLAMDYAFDPDFDGNPSDHLDVLNLSLGSPFGAPDDATATAADLLVNAGVIVVASAGNGGDFFYMTGSPGSSRLAVSVASSTDDTDVADAFRIDPPSPNAGNFEANLSVLYDWANPAVTGVVYYPATNQRGCDPFTGADLTNLSGKIALLDWRQGSETTILCGSTQRTNRALDAGAIGVIFADNLPVRNVAISGNASIPAVITTSTVGDLLKSEVSAGVVGTLTATLDGTLIAKVTIPGSADMVTTTSRGPRTGDNRLKPDLAAPGVGIYSADAGGGNTGGLRSGTSMAAPHVAGVLALLRQHRPTWTIEELKAAVMNTATEDLYTGLFEGGVRLPVSRIGAGRLRAADALATEVTAFGELNDGEISVSYGVLTAFNDLEEDRTIRVKNRGSSAFSATLSFDSLTTIPGVSFSFPGGAAVNVPAGGETTFTVRLSATRSALRHVRDAATAATQGGGEFRHWLSEASGYVVLTPAAGPLLRVAVHAIVEPGSGISVTNPVLAFPNDGATLTLNLTGPGVQTGTGPEDYRSIVTPMELALISGIDGPAPASRADLKYVGVTAHKIDPGLPPQDNSYIYFGIVTQSDWSRPAGRWTVTIYIDTNGDMTPDFKVTNPQFNDRDTFYAFLESIPAATGGFGYLNVKSANDPTTRLFNSNVMILPVRAENLNLGGNTRFHYRLETSDAEWGAVDSTGWLSFDYATPGVEFSRTGESGPTYDAMPSLTLNATFHEGAYFLNGSLGALLLHHLNGPGDRAQVIAGCPEIVVTNPAVAEGYVGIAFSQTFLQSGIAGTATFSIASGSLPSGLTLSSNGTLSGTPSVSGSFPVTVRATDPNGCSRAGLTYSLLIHPPFATSVNAVALTATSVNVSWSPNEGALSYQVLRKRAGEGFVIAGTPASSPFVDSMAEADKAYLYAVRSVHSGGALSPDSSPDLATTVIFTDDPIVAGTTIVTAVHLLQLRTAINAVRLLAGLPAATFTDPSLAGVVVKKQHIDEVRSAFEEARPLLFLPAVTYTDPTIASGVTTVKAAHLNQLRNRMK